MRKGSPEEPCGEDFVPLLGETVASAVKVERREITLERIGQSWLECVEIQVPRKNLYVFVLLVVDDPL